MKIGMIGAGKVGVSLGKYFKEKGLDVIGIYSRSERSAEIGATLMRVNNYFSQLKELVLESDVLFLTVSDKAIKEVWAQVSRFDLRDKIVCHCSGALSSCVFEHIRQLGSWGYSVHPVMTISHKEAYRALENAPFTLEGDEEKYDIIKGLLESLGNPVYELASENKSLYHCAAVFSSNFMVALAQVGMDLLGKCGFDGREREIFFPLMSMSVENVLKEGTVGALTGPVERCDVETIGKHLSGLNGEEKDLYQLLSKVLVGIAEVKNPHLNYEGLKTIID